MRLTTTSAIAAIPLLAVGCIGTVSEPRDRSVEAPGSVAPSGTCDASAQPSPLRRLSATEYWNTVSDLFEGQEIPVSDLGGEEAIHGFTNNQQALAPSRLLVTRYNEAALGISESVAPAILGDASCAGDQACFDQIVETLGGRAFRRPLTASERDAFGAIYEVHAGSDLALAVELLVAAMLQSPQFLYRPEVGDEGRLGDYEVASRLSYFLWSSMPDEALLASASAGRLTQADSLAAEVDRMLADPRTERGIVRFFREWLDFGRVATAAKRSSDGFDADVRASIQRSAERFVWDRVFTSEGSSLETLFSSSEMFVDPRLAALVGVDATPDEGGEWIALDPAERSGILTHPVFLASHGYPDYPSPVLRGRFVLDRILCDPPSPPPVVVDQQVREPPGGAGTNRDRYQYATSEQGSTCRSCHSVINPYGFAFETYDTLGRYRTREGDVPVDASDTVQEFDFEDGVDLSHQLASNGRVAACVALSWMRFASGGGPISEDPCLHEEMTELLEETGSMRDMVMALAVHPKFAQAEVSQ